ncbi:MAG: ABC transporter permease subunit [Candidatus Methanomethylicia archaeon]
MSLKNIVLKEFSDNVASKRFIILFAFISVLSIIAAFSSRIYMGIYGTTFSDLITQTSASIISIIGTIGPLIGIMIGFDAISREYERGSLILFLSCPVYRDTIINGKIIGGIFTIALALANSILLTSGVILAIMGIAPTMEEIIRLIIYFVAAIIYITMYMAISMFTSIATKNSSMSLLISILVWLTFTQLIYNASNAIGAMVPEIYSETRIKVITAIRMLTPDQHYQTFSKNILNAKFSIEPFSMFIRYSAFKPIPLYDSLSLSWPNLAIITSILIVFLALSYIRFLREEVR